MMIITHQSSKDQKNNSFLKLAKKPYNKLLKYKAFMLIIEKDSFKNIMVVKIIIPHTDNGLFIKSVLPISVDIYSSEK